MVQGAELLEARATDTTTCTIFYNHGGRYKCTVKVSHLCLSPWVVLHRAKLLRQPMHWATSSEVCFSNLFFPCRAEVHG